MEQALRNQFIDAIPEEDALCNNGTDRINDSIPDIINFLQTIFCRMTGREFPDKEDEVKATTFDPQ